MKIINKLLVVTFILVSNTLIGQEFIFNLVLQDAIGNKDTLILGYDSDATDSVDFEFNETNIITTKIDSVFDVRITDEWIARMWTNNSNGSFHLKKQIIKTNCITWPKIICLDVKCKNWPVTASWDNSLFNDSCRDGSVLTSIPAGGWWDVGSPSDLFRADLINQNQVTFSANYDDYVNENYAYVNENLDTISVFWVAFANKSILSVGIQENKLKNDLVLFPNPTNDIVQITGLLTTQIAQIDLFDYRVNA